MSIIQTNQLTRTYGRHRGVQTLSLDVPQGSVYGFLGPNGAGKTTAIRVLLGFLRPSGGEANIFGKDCWRDGCEIRRDVGYLPGDFRLYHWMTGLAALRWVGQVRGRDVLTHGRELSEAFGLDLGRRVREMSRGTRQKLGLVLAMAHQPKLLILDEPTASLDPVMQQCLQKRLRELADHGHTVFFSSHTLSEVDRLCDRVAIVREGVLVTEQPLEALRESARHRVMVRWKNQAAANIDTPDFLINLQKDGLTLTADLDGPVERFVSWMQGQDYDDLSIGPPDLEAMFHHFYENGDGA